MAAQTQQDELTLPTQEPPGSNLPIASDILPPSEHCVICLDHISDKAIALPCRHDQFDFSCLGTWLQRQQVCPLCKASVTAIRFKSGNQDDKRTQVFHLPPPEQPQTRQDGRRVITHATRYQQLRYHRSHARGDARRFQRHESNDALRSTWLDFRKQVYRRKTYSLHVGSNRISRYRNLTPSSFIKDDRLLARARMFIRRELQVFDFLNPTSTQVSSTSRSNDRRANNADFLLEYIVGILKSIDLKGSTGQAGELLKDFLGRQNARLFLHELEAWLRSPYENLKDWDRAVQYAMPAEAEGSGSRSEHACHDRGNPEPRRAEPSVPQWFSERFVLGDRGVPGPFRS